jgi:hypothetical protein
MRHLYFCEYLDRITGIAVFTGLSEGLVNRNAHFINISGIFLGSNLLKMNNSLYL